MIAGDPAGLAAAYDRHGAALHSYCRALLNDPAEAADTVQATFLLAVAKLAHLQEPDHLRSWLYAIARNECHRRLRDLAAATGWADSAGGLRELAHVVGDAERSEPHDLVAVAIAGLSPDERDVIEWSRDESLGEAGLGALLGLPPEEVHALALGIRKRFEDALGTLLIASAGRRFCADLHGILTDWDGRMEEVLRARLGRHMETCPVCRERASRPVTPPSAAAAWPNSAASGSVGRPTLRLTARGAGQTGHEPGPPPCGNGQRESSGGGKHAADRSAAGGSSAGKSSAGGSSAGKSAVGGGGSVADRGRHAAGGSVAGGGPPDDRRARSSWVAACTAVALAVAVACAFFLTGARPQGTTPPAGAATVPGIQSLASPPEPGSPDGAAPAPTARDRAHQSRATTGTAPHTSTPEPRPGPSTRSPSPPPSGPPGTLTAAPLSVRLRPAGSFTLTAGGGPVARFTVTVPAAYVGALAVTPASGSLQAGHSVRITVTLRSTSRPGFRTQLTVQPGTLSVRVSFHHSRDSQTPGTFAQPLFSQALHPWGRMGSTAGLPEAAIVTTRDQDAVYRGS